MPRTEEPRFPDIRERRFPRGCLWTDLILKTSPLSENCEFLFSEARPEAAEADAGFTPGEPDDEGSSFYVVKGNVPAAIGTVAAVL